MMQKHPELKQWSSTRFNVYLVEYSRFNDNSPPYSQLFDDEEKAYAFAYDMLEERDLRSLDVLHIPTLYAKARHSMIQSKAELCYLEPQ